MQNMRELENYFHGIWNGDKVSEPYPKRLYGRIGIMVFDEIITPVLYNRFFTLDGIKLQIKDFTFAVGEIYFYNPEDKQFKTLSLKRSILTKLG